MKVVREEEGGTAFRKKRKANEKNLGMCTSKEKEAAEKEST
jgi:hypothetical protein